MMINLKPVDQEQKNARIELLGRAVAAAGRRRTDHALEHRLRRALADVRLDTVLPRTDAALKEARGLVRAW